MMFCILCGRFCVQNTNTTPHGRMFVYSRRTSTGMSMPSWLLSPGRVLLRHFVRSKSDPLVQEVELLEANPNYAHVRFPNGREDTLALKDLAPIESSDQDISDNNNLNVGLRKSPRVIKPVERFE